MKTKIISVVVVIVCCFMLSTTTLAATFDDYVIDDAGLLTQSETEKLYDKLYKISDKHDVDVAVITVDTIYGDDIDDVAGDVYDDIGIRFDGVIFFVSMEEREYCLLANGFGDKAFTQKGQEYIIKKIKPDLSDGDYYECFDKFASLCDDFINQAKTGKPYDKGNLPKQPFNVFKFVIISLVVGFVAALIITGIMKGKLKTVVSKTTANDYLKKGSLNVTNSRDLFLYTSVRSTPKPKQNSSGGGISFSSGGSRSSSSGKF